MARRTDEFQTIRSEGGLLPPDLLRRLLDPKEKLEGTRPEDYGLPPGERLNEVITQSWTRLRKHWAEFRAAADALPKDEPGTGLTNDKWSLPLLRELGFGLLPTSPGPQINGRSYAINRFFGPVPVHLVGCGLSLDRRAAGVRGAAASNPHGLVQEFLNRSPGHLWAIVSNGLRFRVLRDSQTLSRQSFLEFDLEAMFDGEVYSDFVLLWLMAHATRFAPREGERPETCRLEQWTKLAREQGTRALGDLRGGVEKALQMLGEGFTSHPKNAGLRDALRSGQVTPTDFHGQLLRVVYRLIFLFVAEDRKLDGLSLLHPRDNSESARLARERYASHYSTDRLRDLAGKIKGSRHGDLWQQFQLVVRALSGDPSVAKIREHLALPALGSFLWEPSSTASLNVAELTNHDFLEALRHLAFTHQGKVLRPVDYRNLGAEELGGVYESLLALTPQISADGARFSFAEFAGNERKTSGSYYTPDSLVQCLLDSALDPVVEEAVKGKTGIDAEKVILALKVCDPAVGSGHFLVGAAHRLARHLARVRALAQGESEPSPVLYQHALRDVIGRCLYGVDLNPMAAELCRVGLWLEALEPGKPLSFLDHHIRVGNSLLGTTPELIAGGLPDEAFNPIEGDDKKACAALKKRNKSERKGLGPLYAEQDAEMQARLQRAASTLEELPDDRPEDVKAKELAFRRHEQTEEYRQKKQLADTWCSAFVIKKYYLEPGREASVFGITQGHLNDLADDQPLPTEIASEVERLTDQYQFFHWHLVFPEVFAKGGFDCVLGNPPWDQVQFREQEFFAQRAPTIAAAATDAIRSRMIYALSDSDPALLDLYRTEARKNEGGRLIVTTSGRYPYSARGRVNTYLLFTELASQVSNHWAGLIVPSGVATDESGRLLFSHLFLSGRVRRLWEFENRQGLFAEVDSRARFALFTLGPSSETKVDFCFGLHKLDEAKDATRHFTLTSGDLKLLNPNTHTCPSFYSQRNAVIILSIHRRLPVLVDEAEPDANADTWGLITKPGLLNMAADSDLFVSNTHDDVLLPVYEGKMFSFYDHRYADVVLSATAVIRQGQSEELSEGDHSNPERMVRPRYWVRLAEIESRLRRQWDRSWIPGWKEITSPTNARTLIPALLPVSGIGHKIPIFLPKEVVRHLGFAIVTNLATYVSDFVCRNKLNGTSLTPFTFKQLPVLPPSRFSFSPEWLGTTSLTDWILPRSLELTYTAWDMEPYAKDFGYSGPPFRWNEERRFLLRCELDAAFFHLYLPADEAGLWKPARIAEGAVRDETPDELAELKKHFPTPRDAVAYIMDTFPIVRRKDEEKYGEYRTKRVILEIFDDMQKAIRTGKPYQTRLDPPPADPRCCHPPREAIAVPALAEVVPFRRVKPSRDERYKTCVPLLSLKAAAGAFSDDQAVEFEDWIEIHVSHQLRKGMFVVQVAGKSMEPMIPDGSYCLFRYPLFGTRQGKIVLVEYRGIDDPESGGSYTIKTYESEKVLDEDGGWRHSVIRLLPANPAYQPIVLKDVDEGAVRVIAEFVEVLKPYV